MTKTELLDQLNNLKATKATAMERIETMLPWIGNPDPGVRDDLIYEQLAQATMELENKELRDLVSRYLGEDFLFCGIHKTKKQDVLTRTFTLLQLAVVLYLHHQKPCLDETDVDRIATELIHYLKQEPLFQGYHESMGWMHALAHATDVLGQLLQTEELTSSRQQELLEVFAEAFQNNQYTFIDHENERFVSAINHGIASGRLGIAQIERLLVVLPDYPKQDDYKHYFRIHTNVSSVLYAMYFLLDESVRETMRPAIEEALLQARTDKLIR